MDDGRIQSPIQKGLSNQQMLNGLTNISNDQLDIDVQQALKSRQMKDINRTAEHIYDEMVKKFEYSRIIEVDPDHGPITTLEMALNLAEENSIIRLAAGVYSCQKTITKPGLTIE